MSPELVLQAATELLNMDKNQIDRIEKCPGCGSDLHGYGRTAKYRHVMRCQTGFCSLIVSVDQVVELLGENKVHPDIQEGWDVPWAEPWETARDAVLKIYPKSTIEFNPCGSGNYAIASHSLDDHPMGLMLSDGWLPSQKEAWVSAWEQLKEIAHEEERVVEGSDMGSTEFVGLAAVDAQRIEEGGMDPAVLQEAADTLLAFAKPESLRNIQHGGSHYKDMAIEPAYYCHVNKLGPTESSAIRYLSRFRKKGGAEDLKKAIHFCAMNLEWEYGILATTSYADKKVSEIPPID